MIISLKDSKPCKFKKLVFLPADSYEINLDFKK